MDLKTRIHKIYIGFSKPKNKLFPIFSWIIRLVERTPFSHVYARWYSKGAQTGVYYQASGTMVHFLCDKVFEKKNSVIKEYEITITQEQYRKLLHFCMSNAGIDYGLKQVFGIAWSKFRCALNKFINKIFKTRLNERVLNPFADGRRSQVCSELIGALLEDVADIQTNLDLDIAGPRDINLFLSSLSIAKQIV